MADKETKEATEVVEKTKPSAEKKTWEVSGVTIVRGVADYKFYIGDATNYVGALGGDNIDDKLAEQRAMKIAFKHGLAS